MADRHLCFRLVYIMVNKFNENHNWQNNVSPYRDVTRLARRRVLPPGELPWSVTDDDNDRRRRPLLVSPCVGGPVINR